MPVTFHPLPRHNVILFTYSGFVGIGETIAAIAASARHADTRPGMRHLVDVARVTGFERRFPEFLAMQARMLEDFPREPVETLVVWYAPTPVGQAMAQMACNSWDGTKPVIVRLQVDEAGALSLLGLGEPSIDALLSPVT